MIFRKWEKKINKTHRFTLNCLIPNHYWKRRSNKTFKLEHQSSEIFILLKNLLTWTYVNIRKKIHTWLVVCSAHQIQCLPCYHKTTCPRATACPKGLPSRVWCLGCDLPWEPTSWECKGCGWWDQAVQWCVPRHIIKFRCSNSKCNNSSITRCNNSSITRCNNLKGNIFSFQMHAYMQYANFCLKLESFTNGGLKYLHKI